MLIISILIYLRFFFFNCLRIAFRVYFLLHSSIKRSCGKIVYISICSLFQTFKQLFFNCRIKLRSYQSFLLYKNNTRIGNYRTATKPLIYTLDCEALHQLQVFCNTEKNTAFHILQYDQIKCINYCNLRPILWVQSRTTGLWLYQIMANAATASGKLLHIGKSCTTNASYQLPTSLLASRRSTFLLIETSCFLNWRTTRLHMY